MAVLRLKALPSLGRAEWMLGPGKNWHGSIRYSIMQLMSAKKLRRWQVWHVSFRDDY
jgi:hypothetical protein